MKRAHTHSRTTATMLAVIASAILAVACLGGCSGPGGAMGTAQMRQVSYPLRVLDYEMEAEESGAEAPDLQMNLYFVGDGDIPYVAVSEFMSLFGDLHADDFSGIEAVDYAVSQSGSIATVTRSDNDETLVIDADKDVMGFTDFDLFMQAPNSGTLFNLIPVGATGIGGGANLLKIAGKSYYRTGEPVSFDLSEYSINFVSGNGECYIPLQTAADVFLGYLENICIFNGEKVFICENTSYFKDDIYSVPTGQMSESFAQFNYNEFLFVLDKFYGLKEKHNIEDFRTMIEQAGLAEAFASTDPVQFDAAMQTLILMYLDDGHSGDGGPSYLSGSPEDTGTSSGSDESKLDDPQSLEDLLTGENVPFGESMVKYVLNMNAFELYRSQINPSLGSDNLNSYEEVGDTAIVTFDAFIVAKRDYYNEADLDNPQDTIELIAAAHKQINRDGSPIKNVVIDLSCNGGGACEAAAFISAWCKGAAPLITRSSLTGGQEVVSFRSDVNLDGEFDVKDVLPVEIKVYCLTSPMSFSCGNLVPSIFKGSPRITLLGRASGGGTCTVHHCSTASGAQFQISGWNQISTLKNGSFYDIDTGIEPDFGIDKPETYYDRTQLVEYIHSLK